MIWDISVDGFANYWTGGVVNANSGKTIASACEFASLVTGQPLIGIDGQPMPMKHRVSTPDDPLLYWIIGYDSRHIGETIYHKLFMPGLFRIIRDEVTGEWRPFNEIDPRDAGRFKESEPVGPAIPERLIKDKSWVWENKNANYFESVELTNGARIHAYISSTLHPKQGDAVMGIWIDEDIQRAAHLKEWQDRLTTLNGWLLWSAWPHGANPALIGLLQRAKEEIDDRAESKALHPELQLPPPKIEAFKLVMTDNAYISSESKENSLARMGTEDEIARRNEGELLMDQLVMYDFMPHVHLVNSVEKPQTNSPRDIIQRMLWKNGRLPDCWTRYLSIDPSHTRTGVHFAAVPPHEWEGERLGDLIIVETEIVARKRSAGDLAWDVRQIVEGLLLEAMVMDQNAGRQTHSGRDESTTQLYSAAFAAAGIEARTGKSTFIPGCNEPNLRYAHVRSWLKPNAFGHSRLLFVENKTVFTQREFITYTKKSTDIDGDLVIFDEPAHPKKHDMMASLEYLIAYLQTRFDAGDAYVAPSQFQPQGSPAYRQFREMSQKKAQDQGGAYTHLGPGAAA